MEDEDAALDSVGCAFDLMKVSKKRRFVRFLENHSFLSDTRPQKVFAKESHRRKTLAPLQLHQHDNNNINHNSNKAIYESSCWGVTIRYFTLSEFLQFARICTSFYWLCFDSCWVAEGAKFSIHAVFGMILARVNRLTSTELCPKFGYLQKIGHLEIKGFANEQMLQDQIDGVLPRFTSLRRLDLKQMSILGHRVLNDSYLSQILRRVSCCQLLHSVNVSNSQITNAGVEILMKSCPRVVSFYASWCKSLCWRVLTTLKTYMPSGGYRHLDLSHLTWSLGMNSDKNYDLKNNSAEFSKEDCDFNSTDKILCSILQESPNLMYLDLNHSNVRVSHFALFTISRNCRNIEHLNLKNALGLNDWDLFHPLELQPDLSIFLKQHCKRLHFVDVDLFYFGSK